MNAKRQDAQLSGDLQSWNLIFIEKAREVYPSTDPSHDFLHISRVVANAMKLAAEEGADLNVVLPAAYFHDFITVPKNDPRRAQASQLSAAAATEYLAGIGYPSQYLDAVAHAIAAHSFSAGIVPETLEAKVVQDADRLDSLGAIGIARCFATNALMQTAFYDAGEFFPETRVADDKKQAVDHFFVKLFKLPDMMQTESARAEGRRRTAFMREYLEKMRDEASQASI